MPTSPTDPGAGADAILRFADGAPPLAVAGIGAKDVLAVPGEAVAIHWLELAEGLTQAQAAAAARLMLADASAAPSADMHVGIGRPEAGLTPVALAPAARMAEWVADDPDAVVPTSLLLVPPAEGLVRRGLDHRGLARAFSAEPELAALIAPGAAVTELDDAAYEQGLAEALADPVLNLRQGAFAKRRQWRADRARLRRVAMLAVALAALTLILQVAAIMRYNKAAGQLEAEAAALGPANGGAASGPAFAARAALLFEAVRATPNAELTRIDYQSDGSLGATVAADSPATLAAFRQRAEASGLAVEGGNVQGGGGRPTADFVLRAS